MIQSEIQAEHVYARISEHAEIWRVRVITNAFDDNFWIQAASLGDAGDLDFGIANTDVRVEPAAGRGYSVGGNGVGFF